MDGQMKDTKMSDSPSTAVAMRFNSQHQSDKLPDKMVQPWRCHDERHFKQACRWDLIKQIRHFWLRFKPNTMFNLMLGPIFLKKKHEI